MIIYCRNEQEFNDLKNWSNLVHKLMHHYEWLINSRLIEFFNCESWSKLPDKWRSYMDYLQPNHLSQFLDNKTVEVNQVMPLSLMCFRRIGDLFAFERKESNLNELDDFIRRQGTRQCSGFYEITDLNQIDMKNYFGRHLKVKKKHEVGRFASLINNIIGDKNDSQIIDFGSGKGHLDRFLAIYFNYPVVTLELEQKNSERARDFDKQTIDMISRSSKLSLYMNENKNLVLDNLPRHLNTKVTNSNCDKLCLTNDTKKTVLIGLHACGSLSTDLIKLFENGLGDHVFLVSCCYHKCAPDNTFLLSQTMKDLNYNWNYESKEIACHSIENYIEKLKTDYSKLIINCYRAVLENIFFLHYPQFRFKELTKVRRFERLTFAEYAKSATKNLQVNFSEKHLNNESIQTKLNNHLQVIRFYVLRLCLAPMIENVIQVDRMLYLFENKISSALITIFDPKLSPRNFVLFASKCIPPGKRSTQKDK